MKKLRFALFLCTSLLTIPTMTVYADEARDASWGAEDLRRVIQSYFDTIGKPLPADARIGPLDDRLQIAACAETPSVKPRSTYSSSLVVTCKAPIAWSMTLRVEGADLPAPTIASPKVSGGGPVKEWSIIVPRASLPAGTILTRDMLEERVTKQPPGGALIKGIDEAIGLRLIAALQPGNVLTNRNVARAPTIMKGETVTLLAEGEGFSISATGRAEEDGFEGDLVSVRNIKSGMVLSGRVAASGTVIIR